MKRTIDKVYGIIVAAGSGHRFGSSLPKQFCNLRGRPVLMTTIERLQHAVDNIEIILVLSSDVITMWQEMCREQEYVSPKIVTGGDSRWQSVKNALDSLTDDGGEAIVMVHDGARPLVNRDVTDRILAALTKGADGVVPAIAVTDSMREILPDGTNHAVNRANFRAIQTPQAFKLTTLKEAYSLPYCATMTDDASVMEAAGHHNIIMVEGSPQTLKITHPADLQAVAMIMN